VEADTDFDEKRRKGKGAEGEGQRHWTFQWQGSQGQRAHYWPERPAEHAHRKSRSAGKAGKEGTACQQPQVTSI
jgi:hypothetical protein